MRTKSNPVIDRISGEVERTLESFGYELVQLKFGGPAGARTLTALIDAPGGVTARDCQYMASRLSVLLDALDPIEEHYTLVVSSPGVNRPLTRERDFERFAGQKVVIRWAAPGAKARTRRGMLRGLDGDRVHLDVEGSDLWVPLAEIESASIIYDWDQDGAE